MLTMGLDDFIIFIVIGAVVLFSNMVEAKKKAAERKKRAENAKRKRNTLTPAEMVKRQRQQKHKQQAKAKSLDELLNQLSDKKTVSEPAPPQPQVDIEQPIYQKQSRFGRKSRSNKNVLQEQEMKNSPAFSLSLNDMQRAIITKEIIDKPKALRNDSLY